jgi:hypothetical protein
MPQKAGDNEQDPARPLIQSPAFCALVNVDPQRKNA